jgi:hypothetical protein
MYGKDDARVGEGSSDANRFAGESDEGQPVKVPMNASTKGSRFLAGEGEDPTTALKYKAFRALGPQYQRALDVVQAVKDQSRGFVSDVKTKADQAQSDLDQSSTRSLRNVRVSQTERQRKLEGQLSAEKSGLEQGRDEAVSQAKDEGATRVAEKSAIEDARFPALSELAGPAASIIGSQAYHSHLSVPMLVGGVMIGGKRLAPYARARAAYHTPESLKVDPEIIQRAASPALSGPLAFAGGGDPFATLSGLTTKEDQAPLNRLVKLLMEAGKSKEEAERIAGAQGP